jgi:hypothetical protein
MAVVVVSVVNVQVCPAYQHGTIAQSARTEVVVVCGQARLHLLFVSLFWSALLSHCVVSDAPHLNVPIGYFGWKGLRGFGIFGTPCIPWDPQRICQLLLIFRYLLRP